MRSLRHLVKGLSALFWGIPLALLVCVQGAVSDLLRPLWLLPPVAVTVMLLYGVMEMRGFRRDAAAWQRSLRRVQLFAVVNVGLSPFIYFMSRQPGVDFFDNMVGLMALTGLVFLFALNQCLQRLTSLWPDEAVRAETQLFASMNLTLMAVVAGLMILLHVLQSIDSLPRMVMFGVEMFARLRRVFLLFLILLPLAMTMTLLWKVKESVLEHVFSPDPTPAELRAPETANEPSSERH